MTAPLRRVIVGVRNWQEFGPGLQVSEIAYQTYGWPHSRRVVVVREEEKERPEARGRKLIEVPGYKFHAIVTTLELAPVDLWRFYNSRADSENRIKELKEDFGADGFCLRPFQGTEAVFRLICCLYNLVAQFKREVLNDEAVRLTTLRHRLLVVGAVLGAHGRKRVLRLGITGKWRERFARLLARIAAVRCSTVTQLQIVSIQQQLGPPRRWKPRRPYHRPAPVLASRIIAAS
jgi:hypothetical protein